MAPFVFYAGLFTGGEMGAAAMRVLGYFIGCCAAGCPLAVGNNREAQRGG